MREQASFRDFQIVSLMAKFTFPHRISLTALHESEEHQAHVFYDTEYMHKLQYNMPEPDVKIHVHESGSIVLSGAKSREEAELAFTKLYPILLQFVA